MFEQTFFKLSASVDELSW